MRNLLLIAIVFIVVWLLRKSWARTAQRRSPPANEPERMVKCAHCGVNQPISESILTHGRYYCCDAHRLESEATDD